MATVSTSESAGTWNASIIQGETWVPAVTSWQDTAHTIAYVITGWTGTLTIQQPVGGGDLTTLLTLTVGSGLTIGGSGGNVLTITITAAQSTALPVGKQQWKLVMTDASGGVHPWFNGMLTVVAN